MLEGIHSPQDLKKLTIKELKPLCEEIRETIISQMKKTGGHLASNLGVVELTLALHRVFNTPQDKIIWDVGHQCYTHKLITGRKDAFHTIRQKDGLSGFPRMDESPYDTFDVGHASTSIAAAVGFELGAQQTGDSGHVIAFIGDGALTGGSALEALNYAGHIPNNLIIILNDNDMSISRNVGGLSSTLTRLSSTKPYVAFRRFWDRFLRGFPLVGKFLFGFNQRIKGALKGGLIKNRLFSDLGLRYVGPLDGHNLHQLERVLCNVRDYPSGPVVVHVKTIKGKGFKDAEKAPQDYHGYSPVKSNPHSMTSYFGKALVKQAANRPKVVAITAAMDKGTGLNLFREAYPERFYDVGITEPLAVTMSAAMTQKGLKPVVAIYSTFMQRAVDQVIHDVALNSLPVLFVLDRAGLVPGDGQTHQGLFDMVLFRSVPSVEILAPITSGDLERSLEYGLEADHPLFLRIPKTEALIDEGDQEDFIPGRGFFSQASSSEEDVPCLIISLGALLDQAKEAAKIMAEQGLETHIYQLRWAWPLDTDYLLKLIKDYDMVLFLEEGIQNGGVGEYLASQILTKGHFVKFHHKGVPEQFPPTASRKELAILLKLDASSIAETLLESWQEFRFEKLVDQVRHNKLKSRNL